MTRPSRRRQVTFTLLTLCCGVLLALPLVLLQLPELGGRTYSPARALANGVVVAGGITLLTAGLAALARVSIILPGALKSISAAPLAATGLSLALVVWLLNLSAPPAPASGGGATPPAGADSTPVPAPLPQPTAQGAPSAGGPKPAGPQAGPERAAPGSPALPGGPPPPQPLPVPQGPGPLTQRHSLLAYGFRANLVIPEGQALRVEQKPFFYSIDAAGAAAVPRGPDQPWVLQYHTTDPTDITPEDLPEVLPTDASILTPPLIESAGGWRVVRLVRRAGAAYNVELLFYPPRGFGGMLKLHVSQTFPTPQAARTAPLWNLAVMQ